MEHFPITSNTLSHIYFSTVICYRGLKRRLIVVKVLIDFVLTFTALTFSASLVSLSYIFKRPVYYVQFNLS